MADQPRCLIDVETHDELVDILSESHASQTPVRVLGLGSNLLVSDGGVPGVVVRLKGEFAKHSFEGQTLHAGAGTDLRKVIPESVRLGLDGLWQLAGFPATIGGTGHECRGPVGRNQRHPHPLFGRPTGRHALEQTAEECQFSYRQSRLQGIVTHATFQMKAGDPEQLRRQLKEVMAEKAERQPLARTRPAVAAAPKPLAR